MAVDKKFFVDINLQGNALKDAVIGSNSKMGTAGSFRFDGTRLEYFDGSSVQSVANLADISAVTGGLILQGGYDAATNTPDIADTNASKGYFWVVTAAGSFLGESVQVGDSIIAKVDEAGASIGDWLILQGNVVIATDSVDGIVRLATQAEVDAGTEGGAVVLTPATFENSSQLANIRSDISALETDKLSRDGSLDMTGNLDMGTFKITKLGAPENNGDAANKQYVDAQAAAAQAAAEATASADATAKANAAQSNAETFATNAANTAQSNAESFATTAANNAQAAAEATASADATAKANAAQSNAESFATTAANNAQAAAEATASADATAKANAAQSNAESFATTAANTAQSNAETFATTAANTAESNANSYTDSVAATKLDLAGGTMSGNLDMGGNDIGNVNDTATASLSGIAGAAISLQNNIDGNGVSNLVNIPAPTNGGDAANKTYVDDQAAAAQAAAEATASADATAKADAAQSNAESFATTAANNAQAAAEATASADATAKANAAQAAAESYADGLAVNYDPAGAAATAQSNANSYTDSAIAQEVIDRGDAIATAKSEAIAEANSYTDTQITAQTFSSTYADTDWTYDGNVFYIIINHNLNASAPKVACYIGGEDLAEFKVFIESVNSISLQSNIAPPASLTVGVSK